MEIPFKYLHRPQQSSQRDFVIQTSKFRSLGVDIDFSILCGGKRVQGWQCPNVSIGDQIEFFAKVFLNECKSGGDIAVSIGAYGYQTVSAMYITPSCGCECEKVQNQEKLSPLCYGAGDLICGVCECQPGKGGNHCECDLKQHSALSAQELENRCRKTPKDLVCSGNGQCKCGSCDCSVEHVRGDHCECKNMSCPTSNDRMCASQGECKCGKCHCEEGYAGDDCSCTLDTSSCLEGGKICSGQGSCECGKCVCYEGFTGLTCGVVAENEALDDEMPESSDDEVTENKVKEGEEYAEATEGCEMDGQEAGETLLSVDDDTGSTSAELTETRVEAGDSSNDDDEGQTAGCLWIEIHSLILLISLMMLFWP
ncbi:EGF-like domain family protein [Brugia pahangi]